VDLGAIPCGAESIYNGSATLNAPGDVWLTAVFTCPNTNMEFFAHVQFTSANPGLSIDVIANSAGNPFIFVGQQLGTTIPTPGSYFIHVYGTPTATANYQLQASD
jgi:hypothetical protein